MTDTQKTADYNAGYAQAIKDAVALCKKGCEWDMIIHDQWATHPGGREKRADLRASSKAKDAMSETIAALSQGEQT
ncbi:hypothetical protein [Halocynthiibacter sp.]|uniref:hypothetical protein n=1 Tax=Halocynthiibacter sp. TaxID=1979210 RepID=UPI003C471517